MNALTLAAISRTLQTPLTLVHFSMDKLKTVRPLNYWELYKDRQQGRWEGKPQEAFWYVAHRIGFEEPYRIFLGEKGIAHNEKLSFLYATIVGKEQFGKPGRWRHETPLTRERIERSFFDVVGLPKEFDTMDLNQLYGAAGLERALDLWAAHGALAKPHKFMKMTIKPRIEVMTIDPIVPTRVVKN